MHLRLTTLFIAMVLLAHSAAPAAMIVWQTGPGFSGPNGDDNILQNGNAFQAFNNGPGPTLNVNGLDFVPVDKLNQGAFLSGSPGTTNANWNTVIDQTDWHGSNATLSNFFTGLTPGVTYQIQLFASDARGCCNTRTQSFSDGLGNNSPTFTQGTFTSIVGTFTADAATQALGLNASSNNPILNAFVVREISAPGTTVTFIDEDIEGNVNGWSGWGGALAPPYLNLLPLAGDIDDPSATNDTAVPNALNLLNNNVPFANDTQAGTKTYPNAIMEGTYEFDVQVVNWNNAAFGDPDFRLNGLLADSALTPAPASGDDEIWRLTFNVPQGSALIGQPLTLSFGGSTAPGGENFGIDHIVGRFTTPAGIPEPATALLGLMSVAAMARRRRAA